MTTDSPRNPSTSGRGPSRRGFLAAGLAAPALKAQPAPPPTPAADIRYRTLGRTGLKVTTVGCGCMVSADVSVIQRAYDLGITYFDTARVYSRGNNERMVGAALKPFRPKVVLSSKSQGRTKEAALADLDTSLRELGTDYLDVWYIHDCRSAADISPERLEAMEAARKAGKIRFAGATAHTNQADVIQGAIRSGRIDVVMHGYNFAMDKTLAPALETAHRAGIGLVAMKTMAGGHRRMSFYPTPDELKAFLKREGAMLAALKWVIHDPHVATTVPGMADMEQVEENVKAMAAPFSPEDAKILAAQLAYINPVYCRMCNRCEGSCPHGMPVPEVLRALMYADGYGQFPLGREHFLALSPEVRAVRCGDCAGCRVACPNGVRVAERLRRAQELFA